MLAPVLAPTVVHEDGGAVRDAAVLPLVVLHVRDLQRVVLIPRGLGGEQGSRRMWVCTFVT